jgi:hypothetical protein
MNKYYVMRHACTGDYNDCRSAALKELRKIRDSRWPDMKASLDLAKELLDAEGEEKKSVQAQFDQVAARLQELHKRERTLEWQLAETEEDKAALSHIEEIEAKIDESWDSLKENIPCNSREGREELVRDHKNRLAVLERELLEAQSKLKIGFESGQKFFTVAYLEPNYP